MSEEIAQCTALQKLETLTSFCSCCVYRIFDNTQVQECHACEVRQGITILVKKRKRSEPAPAFENGELLGVWQQQRTAQKTKEDAMDKNLGFGQDLMIIGSTGYGSFGEDRAELHEAVRRCRSAKIMLLDPLREGVITRAAGIPDPGITPEAIRERIIRSIDFLKDLRAAGKRIALKLYPDLPLLKLVIAGDYAFLGRYQRGMNGGLMPEYAFKNDGARGSLYTPLSRYFVIRWQDPRITQYDLNTDEIVHHDQFGNETCRVPFNSVTLPEGRMEDEDVCWDAPLVLR